MCEGKEERDVAGELCQDMINKFRALSVPLADAGEAERAYRDETGQTQSQLSASLYDQHGIDVRVINSARDMAKARRSVKLFGD